MGLPRWLTAKNSTCQCKRCRFHPWVRKSPWNRKWQPTPVFLPGTFHRDRSLWATVHEAAEESNMTEQMSRHVCSKRQSLYIHCSEKVKLSYLNTKYILKVVATQLQPVFRGNILLEIHYSFIQIQCQVNQKL